MRPFSLEFFSITIHFITFSFFLLIQTVGKAKCEPPHSKLETLQVVLDF